MTDDLLTRGVEEVIDLEHIKKRIEKGGRLRIKYGMDPTAPDLHLGHAVGLRKLREFQLRGHTAVIVIGDYTTRIGDPSGLNKTRPMLKEEIVEKNAKTYLKQVGKILDIKKAEIHKNSRWLKKLGLADWLKISARYTVAQIMERDDFTNRWRGQEDIGLHELMYPVMQAYDSVAIKADVELGGTDQKFNMLSGRDLQKKMGQEPQDIITIPLLVGLDGKEKMSKSLGNAVGITDAPDDMFGKIMSISDDLIIPYFTLATDLSQGGLAIVKKELKEGINPRDIKARLAYLIVELYYDQQRADEAVNNFNQVFKEKGLPKNIPEVKLKGKKCGKLADLLFELKIVKSKSEAKRLVEQGGVKIDGATIGDNEAKICLEGGMIIKIGKRKFLKVKSGKEK